MGPEGRIADGHVTTALAEAFESGLLPARGRLFVAVSGGQDSLALLHAVISTAPSGILIHAVHVDHGMRPRSRDDARFVARLARSLGAQPIIRRYDVVRWAQRDGINLESAARSVRYRLLGQAAEAHGGGPILTGHTGDDLVETVLLHILRGAGLDGLGGLHPRQSLPISVFGPAPPRLRPMEDELTITRPLLDVERWETAAYCERQGLRWITDDSNADVALTRNRIRHHLVPLLETYNPSVRASIRRLASLARDDVRMINELVEVEWRACAIVNGGSVVFDGETFRGYQRAVASRLMRRAASYLAEHATLSYDQVERCLRLVSAGQGSARLSDVLEWRVLPKTVALKRIEPMNHRAKSRRSRRA